VPSQVQSDCISAILDNPKGTFLVGSQTGTGKTLAYLAPIMSLLKEY
jgi:superfamily II DNA/RNA helicase